MNLYIAYKTKDNLHLTFSFMGIVSTDKLDISSFALDIKTTIKRIEYWKDPNLTVAILNLTPEMEQVKNLCESSGFTYNTHQWIPHLTLGVGEQLEEFMYLIDTDVYLYKPYLRLKEFNK